MTQAQAQEHFRFFAEVLAEAGREKGRNRL